MRKALFQGGSLILAGGLLYLALRGVDFAEVRQALADANYWWLIPIVGTTLLAHFIRAARWKILLDALPEAQGPEARPVSLRVTFYSVMIGYMVNYVAPRMGEPTRAANVAAQSSLRFSGTFGTVVVERLLDMVTWGLGLISMVWLFLDRFEGFETRFLNPALERLERVPLVPLLWLGFAGLVLALAGFVAWRIWRQARKEAPSEEGSLMARVESLLGSFTDGLATLLRAPRRGSLVALTIAMWGCYAFIAHLPFYMLGMIEPYGITLSDSWGLMILGSLGVAIPSPGGVGSYHYVITQALTLLFGVALASAVSYAVITHAFQLILYVIVGAVCLVIQGSSLRALRSRAKDHIDETEAPASSS